MDAGPPCLEVTQHQATRRVAKLLPFRRRHDLLAADDRSDFVPAAWRPFLIENDKLARRIW